MNQNRQMGFAAINDKMVLWCVVCGNWKLAKPCTLCVCVCARAIMCYKSMIVKKSMIYRLFVFILRSKATYSDLCAAVIVSTTTTNVLFAVRANAVYAQLSE